MKGASPFAPLLDPTARALTLARMRAWWEGEAFDEDAARARFAAAAESADALLFDASAGQDDPRLEALARFWGRGRLAPGDAHAEALAPARLALTATGRLAVLGAGLAGPIETLAGAHPGPIEACEWREETRAALEAGVRAAGLGARVTVRPFDLETASFAPDSLDGLVSFDEFTFVSNAPRLALQIAKGLKSGASAILECYVGEGPVPVLAPAFAAAFAEPQVLPAAALKAALAEAGLRLEDEDDLTEPHLAFAREGFKALAGGIEAAAPLPEALREIGWEAQAWGVRLKLLAQRRLERRRFVAVKPA